MRIRRQAAVVLKASLVAAMALSIPTITHAATPSPGPAQAADPRSGPSASLTGDPVLAAAGVVVLGSISAAFTLGLLRVIPSRRYGGGEHL